MNPPPFRIGFGYDIHRLAAGRPLILGGVQIESEVGLEGHSDADCLTHAVADAILGACGERDIGHHFPNTNPDFEGLDSPDHSERSSRNSPAERVSHRQYRHLYHRGKAKDRSLPGRHEIHPVSDLGPGSGLHWNKGHDQRKTGGIGGIRRHRRARRMPAPNEFVDLQPCERIFCIPALPETV